MSIELCFRSAAELARLVATKAVSAHEVMEAHLAQIERVNPQVNAIVTLVPEQALAGAKEADQRQARGEALGPLHGLPIAHKDLIPTKGIRTTFGSPIYQDFVPNQDDWAELDEMNAEAEAAAEAVAKRMAAATVESVRLRCSEMRPCTSSSSSADSKCAPFPRS